MSYFDVMGACNTGCAAPYPAYGGFPYAPPAYPLTAPVGPVSYDIAIGQAPEPAPAPPGMWDRTKAFLQKETYGVKNQNLLLGAAALGTIYYGYTAGWFGKRGRR